jgi:hypothetical protein
MSDPDDELERRLFQAARAEPLPAGGPARVVEALRRERLRVPARPRFPVWVLAAAAAVAAFVTWLALRERPETSIAAEPPGSTRFEPEKPVEKETAPRLEASRPSAVPSSFVPAPARSAPVTLADELTTLKRAEDALAHGDATHALEALDRYDHVLKGRKMRAEATLLRIEALARAGKPEAASGLARRFVAENPGSPLVDRARSFIVNDSNAAGGQP